MPTINKSISATTVKGNQITGIHLKRYTRNVAGIICQDKLVHVEDMLFVQQYHETKKT